MRSRAETLTYGFTTTGRLDTMTGAAAYVTDTGWYVDDLINWLWQGNTGKQVLQQWNVDGIRRLSGIELRTAPLSWLIGGRPPGPTR